jgi:cell division protein FtsQ
MRRPSPLPPPPAAPPRPTPAAAPIVPPDETDDRSDAALSPASALPAPGETQGAPAGDHAETPAGDGERVGVRQVWRAARARRKALRAEVRRFTQRQRRRRAVWLGVLASVVLLVALTFAAAYSPLFAVERITVVGTAQLAPTEVETALAGQLGTPLAAIDESAVKSALIGFPLVESYTLEARPPHELVVRIVERTPVGVVQTPAGFTVVDAAGVALSTAPAAPAGQPLLDVAGGVGSAAFASVGRVIRSLPADIRAQVTAVSASTPDDVTLTLGATGTTVVWGSADESALKAEVLASAMVNRPPSSATRYDVSTPEAVVIR